jgi:sensor histidine kinase YesM
MIKDTLIRLLFIPVLGIAISYVSGIVTYGKYTIFQIIVSCLYFILTSFCIWRGCQWIHLKLRQLYTIRQNPIPKVISVCVLSSLYGSAVAGIFCITWLKVSKEVFRWGPISKFIVLSILAVIVFTLVYEILYLSKERELANKVVDQLDVELTRAEITALRNELDPHFIFNSLSTLSYLITHDCEKADLFNNRLAQVYKYLLINKEKQLVPVTNEIDFIKNYFFLLKIRHEDKIELRITIKENELREILIIPCALQLLIENAIKHNAFTQMQPLAIYVKADGKYLCVENTINRKVVNPDSTGIGLQNLDAQYLLVSHKNIIVEESEKRFAIKLPMIKSPKKQVA